MQSKQERLDQIIDLLQKNQTLTTRALSSRLGVSDMTIRRDIHALEARGFVQAHYGGITLSEDFSMPNAMSRQERDNYFREITHFSEKEAIARYASTLADPQDAIALDNGTTCCQVPQFLDRDAPYIIYTYSYMTMESVIKLDNNNIRLFILGGYYHPHIKMFEYGETLNTIRKLHIDKLFLGASGISTLYGLSCVESFEVPIRQALIAASNTVILLADSSKLGKSWFDHYGSIDDIDILVTDSGITPQQKEELEGLNIDVRIA